MAKNEEQNFAELYENSLKKLEEGTTVKGTIVDIVGDEIFVDLGYNVDGKETHQGFYFGHDWCDPDHLGFDKVKNLKLPKNANDYQKVLLKMAYYFYKWYKEECQ